MLGDLLEELQEARADVEVHLNDLTSVIVDVYDRTLSAWVLEQTYADQQVVHV